MLWQTVYVSHHINSIFYSLVGWIAPLVALMVECYYLGFSMLDYSSERNKLSAQQSIDFIGRHKGLAIGNGMVFYMMHLIPVLGWIFAPSYAVIAATLSLYHAKKSHVIIQLMTTVYLIPCFLAEDAFETIPPYVLEAVKKCSVYLRRMNERPGVF